MSIDQTIEFLGSSRVRDSRTVQESLRIHNAALKHEMTIDEVERYLDRELVIISGGKNVGKSIMKGVRKV